MCSSTYRVLAKKAIGKGHWEEDRFLVTALNQLEILVRGRASGTSWGACKGCLLVHMSHVVGHDSDTRHRHCHMICAGMSCHYVHLLREVA